MSSHIAVLGAGNGAHAFAGDLALRGYRVRLYNKFPHEIVDLQAAGGVTMEGTLEGFGALDLIATEIEPVVASADIIFVVVPAIAHAFMAEQCAPFLRDGQVVLLNPGRTGGALEFANDPVRGWLALKIEATALPRQAVFEARFDAIHRAAVARGRFRDCDVAAARNLVFGGFRMAQRDIVMGEAGPEHAVDLVALMLIAFGLTPEEALQISRDAFEAARA